MTVPEMVCKAIRTNTSPAMLFRVNNDTMLAVEGRIVHWTSRQNRNSFYSNSGKTKIHNSKYLKMKKACSNLRLETWILLLLNHFSVVRTLLLSHQSHCPEHFNLSSTTVIQLVGSIRHLKLVLFTLEDATIMLLLGDC